MSGDTEKGGAPVPGISAIYDPGGRGTLPSMDLRASESALPKRGDVITIESWHGSTTHRVKDVADHGGGSYTITFEPETAADPSPETHYQDETGWHPKHDVYGGPHDEPPQETGEQR